MKTLLFDARRLRGILAEERITHARFAAACGLNQAYVSHVLTGRKRPGELACIVTIQVGLAAAGRLGA
jgi:hypothetical protein